MEAMEATVEAKKAVEVKAQRTGWKKWAVPVGKFLLFGGWMVLIVAGLAIYITVKVLSN